LSPQQKIISSLLSSNSKYSVDSHQISSNSSLPQQESMIKQPNEKCEEEQEKVKTKNIVRKSILKVHSQFGVGKNKENKRNISFAVVSSPPHEVQEPQVRQNVDQNKDILRKLSQQFNFIEASCIDPSSVTQSAFKSNKQTDLYKSSEFEANSNEEPDLGQSNFEEKSQEESLILEEPPQNGGENKQITSSGLQDSSNESSSFQPLCDIPLILSERQQLPEKEQCNLIDFSDSDSNEQPGLGQSKCEEKLQKESKTDAAVQQSPKIVPLINFSPSVFDSEQSVIVEQPAQQDAIKPELNVSMEILQVVNGVENVAKHNTQLQSEHNPKFDTPVFEKIAKWYPISFGKTKTWTRGKFEVKKCGFFNKGLNLVFGPANFFDHYDEDLKMTFQTWTNLEKGMEWNWNEWKDNCKYTTDCKYPNSRTFEVCAHKNKDQFCRYVECSYDYGYITSTMRCKY